MRETALNRHRSTTGRRLGPTPDYADLPAPLPTFDVEWKITEATMSQAVGRTRWVRHVIHAADSESAMLRSEELLGAQGIGEARTCYCDRTGRTLAELRRTLNA
jgi:hypothetical protein